jgi:hypothetical protein
VIPNSAEQGDPDQLRLAETRQRREQDPDDADEFPARSSRKLHKRSGGVKIVRIPVPKAGLEAKNELVQIVGQDQRVRTSVTPCRDPHRSAGRGFALRADGQRREQDSSGISSAGDVVQIPDVPGDALGLLEGDVLRPRRTIQIVIRAAMPTNSAAVLFSRMCSPKYSISARENAMRRWWKGRAAGTDPDQRRQSGGEANKSAAEAAYAVIAFSLSSRNRSFPA